MQVKDVLIDDDNDAPPPDPTNATPARAGVALTAFLSVEAIAGVFYLVVGRRVWFFLDEWDFLVDRRATSAGDLLRSHNGHWVTLPILAYRALFWAVGLSSYLPYQALIVGAHLTAALLLRVVMRRAGVRPWTATVVAGAFALYGTGYQNILLGFQITMVGSLVFGLAHLILSDHDGPVNRNDWFGMLAGLAGLMCSGVGVPFVFAVGLATLIRRGWRVALLHTIPLGVVYGIWWRTIGHKQSFVTYDASSIVKFCVRTLTRTFGDLGQLPGVGVALGLVLIVGLTVAWLGRGRADTRAALAAPTALLVASLVFLGMTAVGRASFTTVVQSRYEHLLVAMLLPALAIAIDALGRNRKLLVPLLALVLVGVPGNVGRLRRFTNSPAVQTMMPEYRRMVLTLPRIPIAAEAPPWLTPEPTAGYRLTIGWLLQSEADGRLPAPVYSNTNEVAVDTLRLSVRQRQRFLGPNKICRAVDQGLAFQLDTGQSIEVAHGLGKVRLLPANGHASGTIPFSLSGVNGILVEALRPVAFRVVAPAQAEARVCASPNVMDAAG